MSVAVVLAVLLAVLIGVSLATLGSGGSIITVPVLVYLAGVPAHSAVGMSLVIVGTTAAAGSYLQSRSGGFHRRAAAIFAATGVAGAFVGARLTHLVTGDTLMAIFAALLLLAGWRMLAWAMPADARRACRMPACLAVGLSLGVLTGFLGIGGGFLIVPALVLVAGLDMRRAVPTSLAIIAFNAAGGLAGQLRYASFDWPLTAAFLGSALTGMVGGSMLTRRLSADLLRRGFAWAVMALGAAILASQVLARAGLLRR
ncbi:MAG: sulfite exporter TauE/SafE family protein [Vicinamibacterales bacterium]